MDQVINLRIQPLPAILKVADIAAHGRVFLFALTLAHGHPVLIDKQASLAWIGNWEDIIDQGVTALRLAGVHQQQEKPVCH